MSLDITVYTKRLSDDYIPKIVQPNNLLFENLHFTSKGIEEKSSEIKKRLKDLNLIVNDLIE